MHSVRLPRLKPSAVFQDQKLNGQYVGTVTLPDSPPASPPYGDCPNPLTTLQYAYTAIFPDSMVAKCTA